MSTSRDQHGEKSSPARQSLVWFLPLLVLTCFLLAGLWSIQQFTIPHARVRDLDRATRYAKFSRFLIEADLAAGVPLAVTLDKIRQTGLDNAQIIPPDQIPQGKSPRYTAPGSHVEAWEIFHGPDGQAAGAVYYERWSDTTIWALAILQFLFAATAVCGVLLIATTWLAAYVPLQRRIADLTNSVRERFGLVSLPKTKAGDPLSVLTKSLEEAEAKMRDKEGPRQRLLDEHTEAACLGMADGTLIEVNTAYARMFGRSPEELAGTNYLDLIPPADRTEVVNGLQKLTPRHPTNIQTHRVVLPDGKILWTRWRDRALFDEQGAVKQILSFGLDVTEEQNLRDQTERLRLAFDQMQSLARTGSLTWNLADDRMEWTEETFRLLGMRREETAPSLDSLVETIAPDDRERLRHLFARARDSGDPFEHEFRAILPDGSVRVLQSRAEVTADPKTKLLDQLTCTLRDITALRDAEAATKRELRFREAIEQSMGVGIVVRDLEGNTLSANPAFCLMTGFGEEELKAATPPDEPYWPTEERPRILAALQQALSGDGPTGGFELVFRRKNGSRFDALVNVSMVLDSTGKPSAILGAVTDISGIQKTRRELAAAENELRQELNYRKTIEKSTTVGLVAIGVDGRPLSANDAYCRMVGYSEEEILAWSPPYPCWPEEEHVNIQHAFDLHLQGKTPTEGFQIRLRKKDGTLFDVIITVSPIMDAEGKQTGLLSALTDVTALQSARRESTASNERLRIAQDVIEFGIWDWDPAADTLFWDRNSFAIFGHPDAGDPQEVWKVVHSEEEQERLSYELKRLIAAGGKSGQDRLLARWPDGSVHDILSTYVIIRDAQGKAVRVLGVNRDVTTELEEERELHIAQERLNAALEGGRFGTFEHIIGVGDVNWSPANYEINGIAPSITDPAELFAAWKATTGEFFPQLMAQMDALPVSENHYSYEFTARPHGKEPRRIRVSVFIERNHRSHPTRLVGVTRRLD